MIPASPIFPTVSRHGTIPIMEHLRLDVGPRGQFLLLFPNGHTLDIPMSEAGLRCLRQLVFEYHKDVKLAEPGALTQYQLNEMVRAYESAAPKKPKLELNVEIEL